jgi:ribosome-associated protein
VPELLCTVVRALDDKKAADLRVLRVTEQSSITDFLVLATGTSEPHLRALRVELEKVLDAAGAKIAGMETAEGSGWTVVDAYQLMIHVFTPEKRDAYRLEQLWKDAEDVPVATLIAPPKAAKASRTGATKAPAKKKTAADGTPAKKKPAAKKKRA